MDEIEKIKQYCSKEIAKLKDSNEPFEKGLIHAYNIVLNKINSMEKLKERDEENVT